MVVLFLVIFSRLELNFFKAVWYYRFFDHSPSLLQLFWCEIKILLSTGYIPFNQLLHLSVDELFNLIGGTVRVRQNFDGQWQTLFNCA